MNDERLEYTSGHDAVPRKGLLLSSDVSVPYGSDVYRAAPPSEDEESETLLDRVQWRPK